MSGYIGDKHIKQVEVTKGLTPGGSLANQSEVVGFLTKNPEPDFNGLNKPEMVVGKMGWKSPPRPFRAKMAAPKLPGQITKRKKS